MKRFVATGLALLCAVPALAFQTAACPGSAAWAAAHPHESDEALAQRDAARSFSHPLLRAQLAERVARDQAARITLLEDRTSYKAQVAVRAIDDENIRWLHALVRALGFPTAKQVGEQGVHDAWVLAQHADRVPAFQARLLPALEERAAQGELAAGELARFTDRLLKGQGKPQRYGTQFAPAEWAGAHFGLPDEASVRAVEANRRALGIMPLADYVCMMSEARKPRP